MGQSRRRIESLQCYEVCFRARQGLPLVAYHTINMIIGAVVARAQRDQKVYLCHDIWNGSHAHLFLVARDAQMFTCFLSEVQKQLTEILKRLLGHQHLNIWEGRPMIAKVLDLEKAIDRISYFYANPAQDNLIDSIEKFPGLSSWNEFKSVDSSLLAETTQDYPWIRQPTVPRLGSSIMSREEDLNLLDLLKKQNKTSHVLTRHPNIWMRCFHVSNEQRVSEIKKRVQQKEEIARAKRKTEGKSVMGVARLTSQEIMKPHTPRKRDRKIFCLSSLNELRKAFIREFKNFCARCKDCFERWKEGEHSVEWPPGAFRPPLRPAYNILPVPKADAAAHFANL